MCTSEAAGRKYEHPCFGVCFQLELWALVPKPESLLQPQGPERVEGRTGSSLHLTHLAGSRVKSQIMGKDSFYTYQARDSVLEERVHESFSRGH
jgi:hypothetical protein